MTQGEMQYGGHIQHVENRLLEVNADDEISGSAEFSGVEKEGTTTAQS